MTEYKESTLKRFMEFIKKIDNDFDYDEDDDAILIAVVDLIEKQEEQITKYDKEVSGLREQIRSQKK